MQDALDGADQSRVSAQDREPFVVVLLDGEGIIFRDDFLQLGEQGGRNAAKQLWTTLEAYVAETFPGVSSPKIMTKIYLNVKGFGEMCARNGITSEPTTINDFIRGFNESLSFFEIVDIGAGKNKAHDKIRGWCGVLASVGDISWLILLLRFLESLKLYLYNCHCHQIFLGCPSTTDYSRFLQDILTDGDLTGRISLVEGLPFEKEMEAVKESYRVTSFPDIFRTVKMIAPWNAPWRGTLATASRSVLTPSPTQQFQQTSAPLSRTSTNTNLSGAGAPLSASTATQDPIDFQPVARSKASSSTPPRTVERNKYGQRVDRFDFKAINRDELNRLKKLKLCNYYFLLGECPNEENCYHDHDRKLTRQELHTLSAIARMTPCRFGLDCSDPDCIYGHRCPQSEPGKKTCFRGESCRFETLAHGIDTNIVKVTKI